MTEALLVAIAAALLYAALMPRTGWRTYEEYLRSPAWRRKRKAALKRDGYCCRLCASPSQLEVHHRCYPKVLGREPVSSLTVLCSRCHEVMSMSCPWVPGHSGYHRRRAG